MTQNKIFVDLVANFPRHLMPFGRILR